MLRWAAEEGRILVTIDTDFGALVFVAGALHAGLIRLPDVRAAKRIALMEQILTRHTEADLADGIVTVRGNRIRYSRSSLEGGRDGA